MTAAAVDDARLRLEGDRIVGHAAPAAGPLPCVLRLEADGAPIALARATGFSGEAAMAGIRFGWCGIELPGARLAAALADTGRIHCHASGRLLLEVPLPPPTPRPDAPPITVEALCGRMRAADVCTDIEQILPFAFATYHRGGRAALVHACYESLLRRLPEPATITAWEGSDAADPVRALLHAILTSAEHGGCGGFIPGPFHPAFAFDRTILG